MCCPFFRGRIVKMKIELECDTNGIHPYIKMDIYKFTTDFDFDKIVDKIAKIVKEYNDETLEHA